MDDLLKVVLDALQERIDKREESAAGLGLIVNDYDIIGIHCAKSFVEYEDEEGLRISIYDAREVSIDLRIR